MQNSLEQQDSHLAQWLHPHLHPWLHWAEELAEWLAAVVALAQLLALSLYHPEHTKKAVTPVHAGSQPPATLAVRSLRQTTGMQWAPCRT